ncbi:MAG: cation diffusion facilitator family transporter [Peptococcaceae bacterium]|nr:cation diffusion facilitator family transporter [Peptococcaceae bacterium]
MEQKVNVAGISIIISFVLAVGKIAAGTAMNSTALLAGGIHSGLDLMAAVLSYFSVNQAKKPADEDHRYGHGKYESVSAVAEALLILIAVAVILYMSVAAILHGGAGTRFFELGIAVMGVSALINFLVSGMLASAYRRTLSPAFRADRRHLLVNAAASAAICAGIITVKMTGLTVIDPVLGVMVALILLREGYGHLKQSAGGIMDVCLSGEEEAKIREVLSRHGGKFVQYHALRTRRSGPDCHVDLHLVVPRDQVISLTHEICDAIENDIRKSLPGVNVLIHPEPCRPVSGECGNCSIDKMLREGEPRPVDCTARQHSK